jgi:tryptophan-rich sensory protein
MKRFTPILLFIIISFLVGYFSMLLQAESMILWYPNLTISSLTPPGYVFSIVWSVLYLLMGISAGLVWNTRTVYSWTLILMFIVQLALNMLWSFCFFYMQLPLLALVVLLALFLTVAAYVVGCYGQNRLAAFLNVPYMLWLLFATYLNGYVVVFN